MTHSESTNAGASAAPTVSKSVTLAEVAEAHGTYHVTSTGPVEHLRDRYVALRDRLTAKGFKAIIDRFVNGSKMIAEFMAIPLEMKWETDCPNIVTTVGKNLALDTFLAGSGYTVVGPYMFLINGSAASAVIGDTMASHAAWLEVGATNAPAYTAPRKTAAWSAAAAGAKALSAALTFAMTSAGSVGGCGLVFGSGAVSTIDSTAGVLYSAGAFTGGTKVVSNGDTLSVTYSASL